MMKALLFPLIGLALAVVTIPAEALAQTPPPAWQTRPGALVVDAQRYRADQNRLEMERLRLGADQRRLEAQLGQLAAQANRDRIVGARQPEPVQPQPIPALRSPEQERAARQAAEQRRGADAETVGQIDTWLDRPVP
ncbi:MAG: hypothetical protein JHC81_02410 [Brevundimonas sp.]|uniref:hypothetical protein n=1 Tax=Brevundimonas sp. TaxID=1871086 RepID=UPI001A1B6483|nr:hypothetical protein [Brevundimonas sp.]MBJ7446362.1 hypothetical protein [Brevundimonas sp.]